MTTRYAPKSPQPFELPIDIPVNGIDHIDPYSQDMTYLSGSINMWLSPEGYVETRPQFVRINQSWEPKLHPLPISGLFYSNLYGGLLYVRDHKVVFMDWGTRQEFFSPNFVGDVETNTLASFVEYLGKVYLAPGKGLWVVTVTKTWTPAPDPADPPTLSCTVTLTRQQPYTNCIQPPDFEFITQWQERLWGFVGSTVYASGYRAPDDWGPIDPALPGPLGGHIDIRPGDGANITGLCVIQGRWYCTKGTSKDKADDLGTSGTFWEITGSSFLATSESPYAVRLINEGVGCVNPHCMDSVLNTIYFLGTDYGVYSTEQIKEYSDPQSVAVNDRVRQSFYRMNALDACHQPILNYYFVLLLGNDSMYHNLWCRNVSNGSWWLWQCGNILPKCICTGPGRHLILADDGGSVYMLTDTYGLDFGWRGHSEVSGGFQYSSGFTTKPVKQDYMRQKWFEWMYIAYQPLGPGGTMGAQFSQSFGHGYLYSLSPVSHKSLEAGGMIWDGFDSQWDVREATWSNRISQWDFPDKSLERRVRVNRQDGTLSINIHSTSAFRLLFLGLSGGVNAQQQLGWTHMG